VAGSRKGQRAGRAWPPRDGRSRFSVLRYRLDDIYGDVFDVAVPVVDHVPLYERLPGHFPGVSMNLVAPPSRHWLGEPTYTDYEKAVILDGKCGFAGCCGVMAHIGVSPTAVVWEDFYGLGHPWVGEPRFEFERDEYEAALRKLPNMKVTTEVWMK
jgi:hypothetical protein